MKMWLFTILIKKHLFQSIFWFVWGTLPLLNQLRSAPWLYSHKAFWCERQGKEEKYKCKISFIDKTVWDSFHCLLFLIRNHCSQLINFLNFIFMNMYPLQIVLISSILLAFYFKWFFWLFYFPLGLLMKVWHWN